MATPDPVTKHQYLQLACTGGFPEVVQRPAGAPRSRWFADYLRTVTQRDIRELKQIEQLERLPRLLRYLTAKIKKRAKIHLVDSGFAAWLRGQSADSLARPTAEGAGPILETFVVNELMKLHAASDSEATFHHFRHLELARDKLGAVTPLGSER